MAIDGGLRALFRQNLKRGFQWTSIETGETGSGVPDSEYCFQGGVSGWVEFKKTEAYNVRLRPGQISWLKVRALRGGRAFVAIRRKHNGGPRKGPAVDELWLYRGMQAGELNDKGLREVEPLLVCGGGPARWDWEAVQQVLIR